MLVFSKMEEEHVQCLCVAFNCFWEHNLKLKSAKCEFFQNEINYLAHHASKSGVRPSKENLKAVAEFALPQLTWKSSLPGLGGALLAVHQGVCMYNATLA